MNNFDFKIECPEGMDSNEFIFYMEQFLKNEENVKNVLVSEKLVSNHTKEEILWHVNHRYITEYWRLRNDLNELIAVNIKGRKISDFSPEKLFYIYSSYRNYDFVVRIKVNFFGTKVFDVQCKNTILPPLRFKKRETYNFYIRNVLTNPVFQKMYFNPTKNKDHIHYLTEILLELRPDLPFLMI